MALTLRLDQRQTQALVMTPQLQQAIKLLQLSNLELTEYIAEELQENPMLERDEGERRESEGISSEAGREPEGEDDVSDDASSFESIDFEATQPVESPSEAAIDFDDDNHYTNDDGTDLIEETYVPQSSNTFYEAGHGGSFDTLQPNIDQTLSEKETLRDHLIRQLTIDLTDPVDRLIGLHLIDMLDDTGYISSELDTVADVLGCTMDRVEAMLDRLQQFDPPGIFARTLAECLALQLADRDRLDPCMQTFLNHLDLLATHDLEGLMKACSSSAEDVADMIAEIKALDPKPALAFDHSVAQPITPDVLMWPRPGGGWIVELNSETLPRVLVNNQYHAQVSCKARTKREKQYIMEQFNSANWLVKSLHQRATTILKVATELVRQQDGFFRHGVQHLKPLVLRNIADEIDMHESTVSRVTSNKYMTTPRGIYELKYFFTSSISATNGGGVHSAEAVRHRIKAMIDEEQPKKVLSDDKIVILLKAEGIDIARRTVAKYRDGMGIPSSVQRRRAKAAFI